MQNTNVEEIERKWVLEKLPEDLIAGMEPKFIEQSYVSINPEFRLTKMTTVSGEVLWYHLTYKGEGVLSRTEITIPVSEEIYNNFLNNVIGENGVFNHKEYYRVPFEYNGKTHYYEMSQVDKSWFYLEVEFDTEEIANAFTPPDWVGCEVTEDKRYKMKSYAYNKAIASHLEDAFAKMYMKDNLPMLLTEEELNAPDMVPEELQAAMNANAIIRSDSQLKIAEPVAEQPVKE